MGVERVLEITAERDDILLRLNDHSVSNEALERKMSKQDAIFTAKTAPIKQLEKKLSLLKYENRLLEETNEEVMRPFAEQDQAVRRVVTKLLKSVASRSVAVSMVISRATFTIVFDRNLGAELLQREPASGKDRILQAKFQESY